jgi:hypothetical protein
MAAVMIPKVLEGLSIKSYIQEDDSLSEYVSLKIVENLLKEPITFPQAFSSYKKKINKGYKSDTLIIENFDINDYSLFYNFFSVLKGYLDFRIFSNNNKYTCYFIFADVLCSNNALMRYNKSFNRYINSDINKKYYVTFAK